MTDSKLQFPDDDDDDDDDDEIEYVIKCWLCFCVPVITVLFVRIYLWYGINLPNEQIVTAKASISKASILKNVHLGPSDTSR